MAHGPTEIIEDSLGTAVGPNEGSKEMSIWPWQTGGSNRSLDLPTCGNNLLNSGGVKLLTDCFRKQSEVGPRRGRHHWRRPRSTANSWWVWPTAAARSGDTRGAALEGCGTSAGAAAAAVEALEAVEGTGCPCETDSAWKRSYIRSKWMQIQCKWVPFIS